MADSDAVHSDIDESLSNSKNDKRVKFGKVNYSKLYKASTCDLKTIKKTQYNSSQKTNKSILLCKRPNPIDEDCNQNHSYGFSFFGWICRIVIF